MKRRTSFGHVTRHEWEVIVPTTNYYRMHAIQNKTAKKDGQRDGEMTQVTNTHMDMTTKMHAASDILRIRTTKTATKRDILTVKLLEYGCGREKRK